MPATDIHDDFEDLAPSQMVLYRLISSLSIGMLLLLLWAAFFTLDVVSIAQGEVIPGDKVQNVQHLEGGVIRNVLVKEGQLVQQGQALVELESTSSGASVAELGLKLASLKADLYRLQAEADKSDVLVLPDDHGLSDELFQQASALLQNNRQQLQNEVDVQQEEIIRRKQALSKIHARIRNQKQRLQLLEEQVAISQELVDQEIASRYEHINLLKEASSLRSQIAEDEEAVVGAQAEINQAISAADNIVVEYNQSINLEKEEAQRSFNELNERFKKFEDDLSRTVLIAPASGIVKRIYLFTRGGVVSPGATVLDIVPDESKVLVEAKLQPQDIGYIKQGDTAFIRLNSVDAVKFGAIEGIVSNISPDTIVGEDGIPYYLIKVETEQDHFVRKQLKYPLVPGVMVSAGIVIGERSVLRYVLSPFLQQTYFALTER